jgi:kynurenine formamidase
LITHNGTHLDAPYHFASTMNHGEPAITIDEVPLEWCFQPGVKLDFCDIKLGITPSKLWLPDGQMWSFSCIG